MRRWYCTIIAAIFVFAPFALAEPTGPYENQPLEKAHGAVVANNPTADVPGNEGGLSQWFEVVVALALVVGLILLLRPLLAKLSGGSTSAPTRTIEVLGTQLIAPRQRAYLLRIGTRLLIVANNGSSMSTLCEITDANEVAAMLGQLAAEKSAPKRAFSSALRWARRQQPEEPENQADERVSDAPSPAVQNVDGDIGGLMDKVRRMSKQFR